MDLIDALQRAIGNQRSRGDQDQPDDQSGKRLGTPVPVRMVFIGRLGGQGQAEQDEAGCNDVSGGLEPVCHHRHRVSNQTGQDLDCGECTARNHACYGDPLAGLHPFPV